MKRLLFVVLTGVLMFPLAAQERLEGVWTIQAEEDEGMDGMSVKMTGRDTIIFEAGGTYSQRTAITVTFWMPGRDAEDSVTFVIAARAPGQWSRVGDLLSLAPDKKKAEAEVSGSGLSGILRLMLVNPIRKEVLKELKRGRSYRIVLLSDSELKLAGPAGSQETYHRVE